ncbi:MAG: leucine-rich repeat domain-containing protein [Clostridia bacterium]
MANQEENQISISEIINKLNRGGKNLDPQEIDEILRKYQDTPKPSRKSRRRAEPEFEVATVDGALNQAERAKIEKSKTSKFKNEKIKTETLQTTKNQYKKVKTTTNVHGSGKKVLITVATIAGLAVIPMPIVAYLRDKRKTFTTYIDYNIDSAKDVEAEFEKKAMIKDLTAEEVDGYRFDGWYRDSDYSDKLEADMSISELDVIYGRYIRVYDVVIHSLSGQKIVSLDEGATIQDAIAKIDTADAEGHTFKGWFLDDQYKNSLIDTTVQLVDNMDIYMHYSRKLTINVNIDGEIVDMNGDAEGSALVSDEYSMFNVIYSAQGVNETNSCGWFLDAELTKPLKVEQLTEGDTIYTKKKTTNYNIQYIKITDGQYRVVIPNSISGEVVIAQANADNLGVITEIECSGSVNITKVYLPATVKTIKSNQFSACSNLEYVNIHENIIGIGDYAFSTCTNLTSINIPNSVNTIGKKAFYGCTALTEIKLPDNSSFREISESAFAYCSSLESVVIPSQVTSIANEAFRGCTSLASITFNESLNDIGDKAFYGCSALIEIEIPASVVTIGKGAFKGCENLSSVTMSGVWYKSSSNPLGNGTEVDMSDAEVNATNFKSKYATGYSNFYLYRDLED